MSLSLQIETAIAVCETPCSETELSDCEKERFLNLGSAARKLSWLRGRAALKQLLQYYGEKKDTSRVVFPNPNYSLTHSGRYAIAAGCKNPNQGIGIDYEVDRYPRNEAMRFFLTSDEMDSINNLSESSKKNHLLRLWTVKEALFKSNLENSNTWYTEYVLKNPLDIVGEAFWPVSDKQFRYASVKTEKGYISMAIHKGL